MQTVVSAMEVRQRFGEILNRVSLTGEEIIIERAGKKIARIVPLEKNQTRQQAHGKLDFRKAAGLGKEIWQEINTEQYLEGERNAWD
jgi:prevent-host-death family protein